MSTFLSLLVLFHTTYAQLSLKSNTFWTKKGNVYNRPGFGGDDGNLLFELDGSNNTVCVTGVVIPISTGSPKRPDAPEPFNGGTVGLDVNRDRGHIFGLNLGGVNDNFNIVRQDAPWQRNGGEWRRFETTIHRFAAAKYAWSVCRGTTAYGADTWTSTNNNAPKITLPVILGIYPSNYDNDGEPEYYWGYLQYGRQWYSFHIKSG